MKVYRADKVWKQMKREGIAVARCTLYGRKADKAIELRGAIRGKRVRTTTPDARAAPALISRQPMFRRGRAAVVIDVFARRTVGWRVSSSMTTDSVLDALEQALYARQPANDVSHPLFRQGFAVRQHSV